MGGDPTTWARQPVQLVAPDGSMSAFEF
jgi:hypothetical protein